MYVSIPARTFPKDYPVTVPELVESGRVTLGELIEQFKTAALARAAYIAECAGEGDYDESESAGSYPMLVKDTEAAINSLKEFREEIICLLHPYRDGV